MERMVSRTLTINTIKVITANLETMKLDEKKVDIIGNYSDPDAIKKAYEKLTGEKVFAVDIEEIKEETYQMTEKFFFENATKKETGKCGAKNE